MPSNSSRSWASANGLPEVIGRSRKNGQSRGPTSSTPAASPRRAGLARARLLDLFTEEVVLERPFPRPDYGPAEEWQRRRFKVADGTHLTEVLLPRKLLRATSGLVDEVMRGIARDIERQPVREDLCGLEWDGTARGAAMARGLSPARLPAIPTVPAARIGRRISRRSRALR